MTACGMIHILLVIAVVVILVRVISGRRIEPAFGCPNKMSVQGVACWRVNWGYKQKTPRKGRLYWLSGGEGGIRTHGTLRYA